MLEEEKSAYMQCSIKPPTASRIAIHAIAIHVLALVQQLTGASATVIESLLELQLLRPSTVAGVHPGLARLIW